MHLSLRIFRVIKWGGDRHLLMMWTLMLWLYVTLASAASSDSLTDFMPTVLPSSTPSNRQNYESNNGSDKIHQDQRIPFEDNEEIPAQPDSIENDALASNEKSAETVVDLTVKTTSGPVLGIKEESGKLVSYFDIPYGQFKNSFEAPTSPEPWSETLKNTAHTVKCPQLEGETFKGDKNCLTISVFTRENLANASVLFYIHESYFSAGSGDPAIYVPRDLVKRNVILVLPNYRLGPLGFLCLRNSVAPGNAALKDLTLALEWTKNNIIAFGGDPTNIAISGDGASAALAGYLGLSPKSRIFASKVIADCGSALSHWAIDRDPISTAEQLATLIKDDEGEQTVNEIFKNVDIEKIIKMAKSLNFRPCIEQAEENSFLRVTPWETLSSQKIELSFIIGTANHAGLLDALKHDNDSLSDLNGNFTNFLPNDLSFSTVSERVNVGEDLKKQYFGISNITLEDSEALSLYHTDASYLGPSLRFARALVSAGARVFLYEFSFVGALNKKLVTMDDPPQFGAVRGDIIGYLFPVPPTARQEPEVPSKTAEEQIVNMMADLWVSFLQTGQPSAEGTEWRPLNATTDLLEDYLSITNETSSVRSVHPERLRLWTEIYRLHFVDRNAGQKEAIASFLIASAIFILNISKFI